MYNKTILLHFWSLNFIFWSHKRMKVMICLNVLLWVLAALPRITWQNSTISSEKELLGSLLSIYTLNQIPRNGSQPLLVSIKVALSNVLNVDILKYTFSAVLTLNQSWYDERLAWDEAEFPFSSITVPQDSVWTPSFTVREAFEAELMTESPNVVLHSNGAVEFVLSLRIDSNCNFDLFYYPLDRTCCTLSFFALANKANELEFKAAVKNELLNLKREYLVAAVNISTQRRTAVPHFIVMITLENTGMRTFLSLVMPSIALVIADLCGFLIVLENRLSYMITLLLAYLVFHSSLVGSLPGSASCNPLLCYYYLGLLVLLFLSTIETILVTKLVADNNAVWLKCVSQEKKIRITTTSAKGQSHHPEDTNDPRMTDCGSEVSLLKQDYAALDRLFFFIYLGLVVMFHFLFTALWVFWKCESEKPPGEDHLLDRIK